MTRQSSQVHGTFEAPIIYFDEIQSVGRNNAGVSVTLVARVIVPSEEGQAQPAQRVVAHLRCSAASAKQLHDALQKALQLGIEPPTSNFLQP